MSRSSSAPQYKLGWVISTALITALWQLAAIGAAALLALRIERAIDRPPPR